MSVLRCDQNNIFFILTRLQANKITSGSERTKHEIKSHLVLLFAELEIS